MLSWMHDPETAPLFARDFISVTEGQALAFVRSSWADAGNAHLAITGDHDEYLGTVSLKDVGPEAGTAEYAIAMTVAARGTGAATAGTRDVLRLAFEGLGLSRVWLCVKPSNRRAIRFYEKVGFRSEGTVCGVGSAVESLEGLLGYVMVRENCLPICVQSGYGETRQLASRSEVKQGNALSDSAW